MNGNVYPLIGSIQNSVEMGFLGNQSVRAIANALGARVVSAASQRASAHGGVPGRSSAAADPLGFRHDAGFVIAQRPAVLAVGFLPKAAHVDIVCELLEEFKGVVLVDPVIGDYDNGLYVTAEVARAIKERLLPRAQIVTPNRFEAEVMLGISPERRPSERAYLEGLCALGPRTVAVTSFERDADKKRMHGLYTNGHAHYRIGSPYYPGVRARGAGDAFAGSLAVFIALGAPPLAAALLSAALAGHAVAKATPYGGGTVDPVAALAAWNPHGHHLNEEKAVRFCAASQVAPEPLRTTAIQ